MGTNRRFGRFISTLFILTLLPVASIFADLDEFGNEVEEDQKQGPDERKRKKMQIPDLSDNPYLDEEERAEAAGDMIVGGLFLFGGWLYHNGSAWYPPYPYSTAVGLPAYVGHHYSSDDPPEDPDEKRKWRLSFHGAGGVFWEDGNRGVNAVFRASSVLVGILAPELEYRWWRDDYGTLHSLRVGGLVHIIQTDPISISVSVAGAFYFDAIRMDGLAVGGEFRFFPGKPVSLEFRGGVIISPEVTFGEISGKIGFHINRFELFAGYYGLLYRNRALHTIEAGVGIHF